MHCYNIIIQLCFVFPFTLLSTIWRSPVDEGGFIRETAAEGCRVGNEETALRVMYAGFAIIEIVIPHELSCYILIFISFGIGNIVEYDASNGLSF